MIGRDISPATFRPMTQEGKNVSSIVIFTEQFEALPGWRLALMIEGINALLSTCQGRFPCGSVLPVWNSPLTKDEDGGSAQGFDGSHLTPLQALTDFHSH